MNLINAITKIEIKDVAIIAVAKNKSKSDNSFSSCIYIVDLFTQ